MILKISYKDIIGATRDVYLNTHQVVTINEDISRVSKINFYCVALSNGAEIEITSKTVVNEILQSISDAYIPIEMPAVTHNDVVHKAKGKKK